MRVYFSVIKFEMKSKKLKFSVVTDIPTPYRVHLFNKFHDVLSERNVEFEVIFMAKSVPIRHWEIDHNDWRFSFRVSRGLHLHVGATSFHFNPSIIWRVIINPPKWLLVGGSWNIPTSFISIMMSNIFHRQGSSIILWSEANRYSMIRKKGMVAFFRKFIANSVDFFAVPGELAVDTIKNEWGVARDVFLLLPNLINENKFVNAKKTFELDVSKKKFFKDYNILDEDILLLWPARLHEKTKGILNFLNPLQNFLLGSNIKIIIAGDGPDEKRIKQWVNSYASGNVILLGQKSEHEMLKLYAMADVLLLPSIRDPNPLSVIEGLWSSLPLLVSKHCGNQIEAVKPEVNGWIIDPFSAESICQAINDVSNMSKNKLREYGHNSLTIAEEKFNSTASVYKFLNELLQV